METLGNRFLRRASGWNLLFDFFFSLLDTKGTRGRNLGLVLSPCFPAFSFSAAGKKGVAGSCTVSGVALPEYCSCLGIIRGTAAVCLQLQGLQVSRCAGTLHWVHPAAFIHPFASADVSPARSQPHPEACLRHLTFTVIDPKY